MAFDNKFMANMGASLTSRVVPTPWSYKLVTDTLAVIKAANYFDDFKDQLSISDTIYIVGSDGEQIVVVTAISPNVLVKGLASENQSHVIVAEGRKTTVGGAAIESFTEAGVVGSDDIYIQLQQEGAVPVSVLISSAGTGGFNVEFSANPGADHSFAFMVVRTV